MISLAARPKANASILTPASPPEGALNPSMEHNPIFAPLPGNMLNVPVHKAVELLYNPKAPAQTPPSVVSIAISPDGGTATWNHTSPPLNCVDGAVHKVVGEPGVKVCVAPTVVPAVILEQLLGNGLGINVAPQGSSFGGVVFGPK